MNTVEKKTYNQGNIQKKMYTHFKKKSIKRHVTKLSSAAKKKIYNKIKLLIQ